MNEYQLYLNVLVERYDFQIMSNTPEFIWIFKKFTGTTLEFLWRFHNSDVIDVTVKDNKSGKLFTINVTDVSSLYCFITPHN